MTDLVVRIVDYTITGGWALVWVVGVCLAIWQILRGRSLAGVALGLASVLGLFSLALNDLLGAVFLRLRDTLGPLLTDLLGQLTFGAVGALILALLVVAAVAQRPVPRPPIDG